MFDIFMFSFNAVMPILLVVAVGYILKITKFASDEFFKKANSMVFHVFLPILLFYNVYEITNLSDINWRLIIYIVAAVLFLAAFGIAIAHLITKRRDRLGVIAQCSFRSNHAIIGITLAQSIGGTPAIAFASVVSAAAIPLFNILAVIVLSYYAGNGKNPSVKDTLIRTVKNPLIIGVACGLLVLVVRSFIPVGSDGLPVFYLERDLPFLMKALESLSKIASPLALVILGARFDFSAVKGMFKEISAGVILRLVAAPFIGIGMAYLLSEYTGLISVSTAEYPALIAVFSSPVAVSSAVMVGEIGGDDQLATQLVVWTSVLSMLSNFIIVFMLKSFSLI
ncbi:MAG: AEC family transporter [Acutalibacteraceae bacterium]